MIRALRVERRARGCGDSSCRRWLIGLSLVLAACGARAGLEATRYTIGGDAPTSLLVALHYSSATPAMWDPLVANWGRPLRVMFPRGPIVHHREGFTWFARAHEQKDAAGKRADIEAMTDVVADAIRRERAAHPEIRRVAVTGFSYGGDIAFLLALRYPELVDVAIPMGSRLVGEPTGKRTSRIHVLQGEVDNIIDARATAARVAELQARGIAIDVTIYPQLGHDISPALIADWRAKLDAAL